jgi:hypothetical protein
MTVICLTPLVPSELTVVQMGAHSGDPRFGSEWEDADEDGGPPQCATQ